ncbi:MAG: nucleoside triphosphate pyrophosphohydrolase [Bacteroidota bacterium]
MSTDHFPELVAIVRKLRKDCPWDRQQTHESIRHHLIEETYEIIESIDNTDWNALCEELGDVLLHVILHSVIAEEKSEFHLEDVIEGINAKLIRRHPHVFGDTNVSGAEEVKQNWEKLKMIEGRKSHLDGVPKELPALLRAQRLQERAAKVGFDWEHRSDVWKKVDEEVKEFHAALEADDLEKAQEEFGDLLFSLVNYARFLKINPELSLRKTTDKFIKRFKHIEQKLKEQGKDIQNVSLAEMDMLWNEAKDL